jgi:hypothetical protein
MFCFLLILLAACTNADLVSDRVDVASKWAARLNTVQGVELVYADQYMDPNFVQVLRGVGNFGPRLIAKEYTMTIFVAQSIFGFIPSITRGFFDASTSEWVDANTLRYDYTVFLTQGFNQATGLYFQNNVEYRMSDYTRFLPNSSVLLQVYSLLTPDFIKAGAEGAAASTPSVAICSFFIFQSCNGSAALGGPRPYLNDTGFTTVAQCTTFLNALPPTICPFPIQGNTAVCRSVHGLSAVFDPAVHCPHVRPVSAVCREQCLDECVNCHANATCIPIYPGFPADFTTHYKCECARGFVGNGTSCAPLACDASAQCPAPFGTYECSTGLCKCTESFTQHTTGYGTSGLCTCDNGTVQWVKGKPICVPDGRCMTDADRWMCTQKYNEVKCHNLTNNTWTQFGGCKCNYGFTGGWRYPCSCPSPRRKLWADLFDSFLCLNTTECTEDYDCAGSAHCVGEGVGVVGTCVSRRRHVEI